MSPGCFENILKMLRSANSVKMNAPPAVYSHQTTIFLMPAVLQHQLLAFPCFLPHHPKPFIGFCIQKFPEAPVPYTRSRVVPTQQLVHIPSRCHCITARQRWTPPTAVSSLPAMLLLLCRRLTLVLSCPFAGSSCLSFSLFLCNCATVPFRSWSLAHFIHCSCIQYIYWHHLCLWPPSFRFRILWLPTISILTTFMSTEMLTHASSAK